MRTGAASRRREARAAPRRRPGWAWRCLVPVVAWIAAILFVASRPAEFLLPADAAAAAGIRRDLLQYPYHVTAFFVLAILLLRCAGAPGPSGRARAERLTLAGAVLVSLIAELVQFWTPTRTPAVRDLALDLLGTVIAVGTMRWWWPPAEDGVPWKERP